MEPNAPSYTNPAGPLAKEVPPESHLSVRFRPLADIKKNPATMGGALHSAGEIRCVGLAMIRDSDVSPSFGPGSYTGDQPGRSARLAVALRNIGLTLASAASGSLSLSCWYWCFGAS